MLTPEPRTAAPPRQALPYPSGLLRHVMRAPLFLHRLGLGRLLNAAHITILTTRGRKSGQPRHVPIEYRMHGTKVYLISGWGERPHWVQNLLADPNVTLQAGGRTYGATAHVVQDTGEALRALFLFRKRAPAMYDALIARLTEADSVNARKLPNLTDQLTVVRLDLDTSAATLPGLASNLRWVWPLLLVSFGGLVAVARLKRQ